MTCDFHQCGMSDEQNLRSYAQSDGAFACRLNLLRVVMLLTEFHLEFLAAPLCVLMIR